MIIFTCLDTRDRGGKVGGWGSIPNNAKKYYSQHLKKKKHSRNSLYICTIWSNETDGKNQAVVSTLFQVPLKGGMFLQNTYNVKDYEEDRQQKDALLTDLQLMKAETACWNCLTLKTWKDMTPWNACFNEEKGKRWD